MWIGVIAGFILLLAGLFSPRLNDKLKKNSIRWGAIIILLLLLGPSSIKGLELAGLFKISRYKPTTEERNIFVAYNKNFVAYSKNKPSAEVIKKAKPLIEAALSRSPEKRSAEDYLALATKNWLAKNYDEALADVYAGLNLEPEVLRTKATLIFRKASIYQDLGLADQAINLYKEAIALDSQFSWPNISLGIIYRKQGKFKEAEELYNKAIQLDPDFPVPYNNLGIIYWQHGKLKKAEEAYNKAIRLDSDYASPYDGLGNIYQKQGKLKKAEEAYNKAIRRDPDYASPYEGLGIIYENQGKFKKAEEAYKNAIRLDSDYASFYNGLGIIYKKQEMFNEAEEAYNNAIRLDPNDKVFQRNLERLRKKMNE